MTEPEEPAATTEQAQTDTSGPAVTAPTPPPAYALGPTRRCLQDAGFAVSKVRSADPRLRALGDLAQRTSLEARRGGQTLGLALGDTRLLASLLLVPNDPYRLEVSRNALLMYRPSARDAATAPSRRACARRSTLGTNRRCRLRGECSATAATGAVGVEVAVLPVVAV